MNNRSNCTYICWSFVFSQTISIWLLVLLVGPRRLRHRHRDCRRFHIVGIFFFTVKCSSHRCRLHIDGFLSIPFVIFFFLLLFLDFHFALFTTIVGGCWLRLRHRGEHYRFCSHISFNIRHNNIVVLLLVVILISSTPVVRVIHLFCVIDLIRFSLLSLSLFFPPFFFAFVLLHLLTCCSLRVVYRSMMNQRITEWSPFSFVMRCDDDGE